MTIYYSPSKEAFYDTDAGFSSLPEDIIDVTNIHANLLYEININNKVIVVKDGVLSFAERNIPITWDNVRRTRNDLLKNTDWTQMPDYSSPTKLDWANYRQALRDIPQIYQTPNSVIWPTSPN